MLFEYWSCPLTERCRFVLVGVQRGFPLALEARCRVPLAMETGPRHARAPQHAKRRTAATELLTAVSANGTSRFLASGDEAGTAPGDRKFRPDVEGLRAVAVLLVVLYHAGVPKVTGGYIGVDVFFVLSGFVITGLLLRERSDTNKTSLLAFYGRRCRRILPAATLVVIITVLASYHWLGFLVGNSTAEVGRTASLFYANFHFISVGTNYLSAQAPPSALQNYWSLSVEEQFYVIYPTLFIFAAMALSHVSLRLKLTALLVASIAASFIWSIHQTSTDQTAAYFSPFTHAWELALGGLVAVGSLQLAKLPRGAAIAMTWAGLAGILIAAFEFTNTTAYPGSVVALPVVSTALVVAGGTAAPQLGAEILLRLFPFRWLGKLSYSLYLWHWPILIIAAQYAGRPLSVKDNMLWVLVALALSIVSYFIVENPIRHWRFLSRSSVRSVCLGAILIGISLGVMSFEIGSHP
jgi:peptidoglycan/LPS O-acetylase OafA/YrhL